MIPLDISLSVLRESRIIGRRTENCLNSIGIFTVRELMDRFDGNIADLMNLPKFGKKSLDDVMKVLENVDRSASKTQQKLEPPHEQVDAVAVELGALSDIKKQYIESEFQKAILSTDFAPVRAQHGLQHSGITYVDVLRSRGESINDFIRFASLQHVGRKTVEDIYNFSQKFLSYYDGIVALPDSDVEVLMLQDEFSFLDNSELTQCHSFKSAYGHLPLFRILLAYLRTSQDKKVMIYSMSYGISTPAPLPLHEVAARFDITYERARQLLREIQSGAKGDSSLEHILSHGDWSGYATLFSNQLVFDDTVEWKWIASHELQNVTFPVFVRTAGLLSQFQAFQFDGFAFLQSSTNRIDVSRFYDKVVSVISDKYYDDAVLDLESLFGTEITDITVRNFIVHLVNSHIAAGSGIRLAGDKIIIPQNAVDIECELCKILRERNDKMSIDELTDCFNAKVGNIRTCTKGQLKPFIFRSNEICSCGKSGYYGLKGWDHVYYGTIRDLIFDTLSASDMPVHISAIFDKVSSHFDTTTLPSLAASMESDTAKRFVKFEEGYYGLFDKSYPDTFSLYISKWRTYSFQQRIDMFTQFVAEHHRYPFSGGGEDEAALYRWYYNVTNHLITGLDEEQSQQFWSMIERYESEYIPRNNDEYKCYCNCRNFINFFVETGNFPDRYAALELRQWFRKYRDSYLDLPDFRKHYFAELYDYVANIDKK